MDRRDWRSAEQHHVAADQRPVRRWWGLLLLLALAVGVGLASLLREGAARERDEASGQTVRALAMLAALDTRPVAGRLIGFDQYRPREPQTRGTGSKGVRAETRIASATILQIAEGNPTPRNLRAQGAALLYLGDADGAIEVLTRAAGSHSASASVWNDLSVAYLARAEASGSGQDWAAALDAAERALQLDPRLTEAYFNSCLALDGLHLTTQGLERRGAYRSLEPSALWLQESEQRRQEMASRHAEAERRRQGSDRQRVRERVEDVLLADWGRRILENESDQAERVLAEAGRLAADASVGDDMAAFEIRLIRDAAERQDSATLRRLAHGHVLFGRARREYRQDNQAAAAALMEEAATHFRAVGSAYGAWAPIYRSISLRNQGEPAAAAAVLVQARDREVASSYPHVRGRREWALAVAYAAQGRYDLTLELITRAMDAYREAGEVDNLLATRTIKAEANWMLGNTAGAWQDILGVLETAAQSGGTARDYHYWIGSALSLGDGWTRTASILDDARVRAAASPRSRTEAHLNRARTRGIAGDADGALEDLRVAEREVAALADPALRERNQIDIRIARANVLVDRDPAAALAEADVALHYVPKADPATRLADLLALRARCRQQLGDPAGARADLVAAIESFESKRQNLRSVHERTQAFERERRVFKQLIALEAGAEGGVERALAVAERSRAGALIEAWRGPAPVDDVARARSQLHRGVAVVYYETLPDSTLVWVLTAARVSLRRLPMGEASLAARVAEITREIARGATATSLQPISGPLVATLIEPALAEAGDASVVFFVPDGPLHQVPFGALPDHSGTPLLARRQVGVTPSLTTFVAASRGLALQSLDSIVAVGDGHDPRTSGLPPLHWADREASDVAAAYDRRTVLRGPEATRGRSIAADAAVLHFAGHTVISRDFPAMSRMLFAPDGPADAGPWLVQDILQHQFSRTRVVVLSSCEGAAGRVVAGEGAISVARAFFAAGVPAVVASLWPVDDDAFGLMVTFHRELRAHGNPAEALRVAQLAQMHAGPRDAPIRRWGGFVAYGGAKDAVSTDSPH